MPFGEIVLVVRSIGGGRVSVVGLRLPEDEEAPPPPLKRRERAKRKARQVWKRFVDSLRTRLARHADPRHLRVRVRRHSIGYLTLMHGS